MEQKYPKLDIPSKEELKEIMKIPGKIKGAGFRGDREYVLEKKGEQGLRAVEKETERLGYPIEYKKIKETEWYPVGLRVVSLSTILKTFNWGEKELGEIGETATKVSFIVRIFMKYFISPPKVFYEACPRMWKRYYRDAGGIETIDFKKDEKGGYAILRIKGLKLHPIYCYFFSHFVVGITRLSAGSIKKITVEETKCMFRGDPYHEYLIKWTYQ